MPLLLLLFLAAQFDAVFRDGLVALNQSNLQVAESRLTEAAQIEPKNPRVWLALAQTLRKLQKDPRSAAQNAEKWAGNDAVVVRGLALFYADSGDSKAAARMIQGPAADESFIFELAQKRLEREDFAAAANVLDAGRKRFPQSAQLALAGGVALYGLR